MQLLSPAFRFGDTPASKEFIANHIKRLSVDERSLRFFSPVTDAFIEKYVDRSTENNSFWIVVSDIANNNVVAALHVAMDKENVAAEIGFSVEKEYSGQGLGTTLIEVALLTIRPLKVKSVILNCLSENKAVQAICKKVGIDVSSVSYSEKEGTIEVSKDLSVLDIVEIAKTTRTSVIMPPLMIMTDMLKKAFPAMYGDR